MVKCFIERHVLQQLHVGNFILEAFSYSLRRDMAAISGEDIGYRRFRRLLFTNREKFTQIYCGSTFELPVKYFIINPRDIDIMCSIRKLLAFDKMADLADSAYLTENRLLIDTNGCHIGFTKLRKGQTSSTVQSTKELFCRPKCLNEHGATGGPAYSKDRKLFNPTGHYAFLELLRGFNSIFSRSLLMKYDHVFCIYCPSWPDVANEWITRRRENGWPTVDVIDKVVQTGCHLVSKPHQSTPNDNTQWRFSFSLAEAILIQQWTSVQTHIYHVLRMIKCDIAETCGGEHRTVLCTYFLKTLMLWKCEGKPQEFWNEENTETVVEELLCTMIEWLIEKSCRNYFIPENNMLDHLIDDEDLSKEILLLHDYATKYLKTVLFKFHAHFQQSKICIEMPNKLVEYAIMETRQIFHLRSQAEDMLRILISSNRFLPELRLLFRAINAQKHLLIDPCTDIGTVSEYFNLAKDSVYRYNDYNPSPCLDYCVRSDKSLSEQLELFRTLVKKYFSEALEIADHNEESKTTAAVDCGFNEMLKTFTREVPSPVLILASAFYANFLYIALKDYKSALEHCRYCFSFIEKLENDLKIIAINRMRNTLRMPLTNELSAIFDHSIQTVIGFATLCSAVRTGRCRKVVVDVSPYVFLEYIEFQSSRELKLDEVVKLNLTPIWRGQFEFYGKSTVGSLSDTVVLAAVYASGLWPIKK